MMLSALGYEELQGRSKQYWINRDKTQKNKVAVQRIFFEEVTSHAALQEIPLIWKPCTVEDRNVVKVCQEILQKQEVLWLVHGPSPSHIKPSLINFVMSYKYFENLDIFRLI